jgi:pimeloyl-ACP methyl ester carboxylesterase
MTEQLVDVGPIRLHVIDRGIGPAYVLQHGLCGTAQAVLDELGPSGHRVIAMDSRGHGGSPLGPADGLSYAGFASDLASVLDQLDIDRAVVAGVSMGAGVAVAFALAYPQRVDGVVLVRPVWDDGADHHLDPLRLVAALLRRHGADQGAEAFQRTPAFAELATRSPANARAVADLFAEPRAVEAVARIERMVADRPWTNAGQLSRLRAPALVVGSSDDAVHPLRCAQWLARQLPTSTFRRVTPKYADRGRHLDEVRGYVDEFLRSLERVPC